MNGNTLLSPQGLARLEQAAPVASNMAKLLSPDLWEDALAYLTSAFPPESLISGLLQIMSDTGATGDKAATDGIAEIRAWLKDRNDERRWRIFQQSEALGFATPLGAIGLALFWMGGSMTPANCEPVYADKALIPQMLHTALRLMAIALAGDNPPHIGAEQLFSRWLTTVQEA